MIRNSKIFTFKWWFENKIAMLYVLVILFFYGFIASVIVNIPFYDDHNAFYRFLNTFEKRGWSSLFKQHNEHRIIWFKLLVLFDNYITTSVHITHYIWLGVLSLLGIAKIIYASFSIYKNKLLLFFPVFLLIFLPITEMHNWGMATFVNITVVLFLYSSIFFLSKENNLSLFSSIFFSVVATFSNGAGFFIYPIGIFFLIAKTRWKHLLVWIITCLLTLSVYFFNYKTPKQIMSPIEKIIEHSDQVVVFIFTFMGSSLKSLFNSPLYITIAGAIIVVIFIIVFLKKWRYFISNPLMLSYLLFVFLSVGAASVSRGMGSASADRYQLSQILGLSLIYLCSIEAYPNLSKKAIKIIIGFCIILYTIRLYDNIPKIILHKERLEASYLSYLTGDIHYIDSWPHRQRPPIWIKEILDQSTENGLYTGTNKVIPIPQLYDMKKIDKLSLNAKSNFTRYKDTNEGLIIHGNALVEGNGYNIKEQSISILLESDKIAYVIPTKKYKYYTPQIAKGVSKKPKQKVSNKFPKDSAFYFNLPKEKIDIIEGDYKLSVLVEDGNKLQVVKHFNRVVSFAQK